MVNRRETIADHAWKNHSTTVDKPMDLSHATPKYIGDRFDGFSYYVDGLGFVHLFLNMNPIDKKGFVLDENYKPTAREVSVDEILNQFPALTMSVYVFEGGDYYKNFQPNPVESRGAKEILTELEAKIHFPNGLTFHSPGAAVHPAMAKGPQDRTLRWTFERWNLEDDENLPIYLTQNPEFFKEHTELIKPEIVKLERPEIIKMGILS